MPGRFVAMDGSHADGRSLFRDDKPRDFHSKFLSGIFGTQRIAIKANAMPGRKNNGDTHADMAGIFALVANGANVGR